MDGMDSSIVGGRTGDMYNLTAINTETARRARSAPSVASYARITATEPQPSRTHRDRNRPHRIDNDRDVFSKLVDYACRSSR